MTFDRPEPIRFGPCRDCPGKHSLLCCRSEATTPTDDPCDETPVIRDGVNWFLPPETKFWTVQPEPYRK